MSDDLPVKVDGDGSADEEGLPTPAKWALGIGGVVVAAYLVIWVFNLLVGLAWVVGKWALLAALIYGGYRVVKSALSDDTATTASEPAALPREVDEDIENMSVDDIADDDLEAKFAELEEKST